VRYDWTARFGSPYGTDGLTRHSGPRAGGTPSDFRVAPNREIDDRARYDLRIRTGVKTIVPRTKIAGFRVYSVYYVPGDGRDGRIIVLRFSRAL